MPDNELIRKQYIYDGNGRSLIYPATKVAAIGDLITALFAFKEQFIDPEITVKTHEAETAQEALDYSQAHPDVLVYVAK